MNIEDAIARLQAAQGDPRRLTLATVDIVLLGHEPGLRKSLEAAAIPHWFNPAILARLLETDEGTASGCVSRLSTLPMVESFAARGGWNVHEAARLALRAELARQKADELVRLSAAAAACFPGDEPHQRVERVYHQLIATPESASNELERLHNEWHDSGRFELLHALGLVLAELLDSSTLTPPARAQSLLCLGLIRRGRFTAAETERIAREALALFRDSNHESGEVASRELLGDMLETQGKLADALREYEALKEIMVRLVRRNPDNTGWQRGLSVACSNVGDIHQAQGRLADALREYEAAKKIIVRLTQRDPHNTGWQRDLSVACGNVGDIYEAQDRLADALREFERCREIMVPLTQRDSDNTGWQRELSVACNKVGVIHRAQGQLADALREFEAAKEIRVRLTQRDPDNTGWQRDLSVSCYRVGTTYQAQGRLADALREYEADKEITVRLTQHDPDNTGWQRDLSVCFNNTAFVNETQRRFAEALQEYQASLEIIERLCRHDPTNHLWQQDLERTRSFIARVRKLSDLEP